MFHYLILFIFNGIHCLFICTYRITLCFDFLPPVFIVCRHFCNEPQREKKLVCIRLAVLFCINAYTQLKSWNFRILFIWNQRNTYRAYKTSEKTNRKVELFCNTECLEVTMFFFDIFFIIIVVFIHTYVFMVCRHFCNEPKQKNRFYSFGRFVLF